MYIKACWTVCLSVLLLHTAFAQVDRARIERNIGVLASDEMDGRKAGTPSEQRAAQFIAEAFKDAGLTPYEGTSGFLQKFSMTLVTPKQRKLLLNDLELAPADYLIASQKESAKLEDLTGVTVFVIDAATIGEQMPKARSFKGPKLVLINTMLGSHFRGYFEYFGQPQMVENADSDAFEVWAITDQTEITSILALADNTVSSTELMNVIGVLPGTDASLGSVLFSAHFDHIGHLKAVDGDEIANGADDDASGVIALIELANHYKNHKVRKRTLIFSAFTAEELGGFGSKHLAAKIDPATIAAGINIEMIGKLSKFGIGQGFITGYELSTLPAILAKAVEGSAYKLHPDPYPEQNLFYRSDNAEFARKGIPAHTVGSSQIDQDPYYHTVNDEIETLDMNQMEAMIRAIALGSEPIVNGSQTPSRIAPGLPGIGGR